MADDSLARVGNYVGIKYALIIDKMGNNVIITV